ncbi:creatininase family protein [Candidatus Hydrogenedentota bacterium]
MTDKVLYEELTPREFKERLAHAPIAYIPLGTLEWHGEHLPLGSDGLQSKGFFEHLAKEVGGIVLPMIFLGPDRSEEKDGKPLYGMDICKQPDEWKKYEDRQLPGSAYWAPEETYKTILDAVLVQLARAGFRVVVAHGHGPSNRFFRENSPEWKQKFGLECIRCTLERDDPNKSLGIQTDHAGQNETSVVMALRPELVQMGNLDSDTRKWPLAVSGQDPRTGSAEIGNKAIAAQVARMSGILRSVLTTL